MTGILVKRYYPLLVAVVKIKDVKCRNKILKELSKDEDFAKCMKEITENVLEENITLSVKDKKRLNKHAKVITNLQKGRGISQSGGFLNIVVPLLATVVSELLSRR